MKTLLFRSAALDAIIAPFSPLYVAFVYALIIPVTSKACPGLVLPIPTLPPLKYEDPLEFNLI